MVNEIMVLIYNILCTMHYVLEINHWDKEIFYQ